MTDQPMSEQPIDSGGPAYPSTWWDRDSTGEVVPREVWAGMTLRDWFAGQALAGLLANPEVGFNDQGSAECSYSLADAMLAERAKRQVEGEARSDD